MKKVKDCPDCGGMVGASASACPHCGAKLKAKTSTSTWVIGGLFAAAVFALASGGSNAKECPPLDKAAFGLPADKADAKLDFMAKAESLRSKGICPIEGSFGRSHNKFYFAVFDSKDPKRQYFVRLTRAELRQ